jgi:ribosome-binding protein aMBF1 (putative translation factor)
MQSHPPSRATRGEGAEEGLADEEFRREWERLSLARAVAARLIGYRADHGISQGELASRLGLRQTSVARLEVAGHVPSCETLAKVSSLLGIEFTISIAPADRPPRQLTKAAREKIVGSYETGGATVRLAAG